MKASIQREPLWMTAGRVRPGDGQKVVNDRAARAAERLRTSGVPHYNVRFAASGAADPYVLPVPLFVFPIHEGTVVGRVMQRMHVEGRAYESMQAVAAGPGWVDSPERRAELLLVFLWSLPLMLPEKPTASLLVKNLDQCFKPLIREVLHCSNAAGFEMRVGKDGQEQAVRMWETAVDKQPPARPGLELTAKLCEAYCLGAPLWSEEAMEDKLSSIAAELGKGQEAAQDPEPAVRVGQLGGTDYQPPFIYHTAGGYPASTVPMMQQPWSATAPQAHIAPGSAAFQHEVPMYNPPSSHMHADLQQYTGGLPAPYPGGPQLGRPFPFIPSPGVHVAPPASSSLPPPQFSHARAVANEHIRLGNSGKVALEMLETEDAVQAVEDLERNQCSSPVLRQMFAGFVPQPSAPAAAAHGVTTTGWSLAPTSHTDPHELQVSAAKGGLGELPADSDFHRYLESLSNDDVDEDLDQVLAQLLPHAAAADSMITADGSLLPARSTGHKRNKQQQLEQQGHKRQELQCDAPPLRTDDVQHFVQLPGSFSGTPGSPGNSGLGALAFPYELPGGEGALLTLPASPSAFEAAELWTDI